MSNVKKGECEICGFADDSYRIDENGSVLKVCKFCHDGYLERMGLSPDTDKPIADVTLTLDLDAADDTETEENLNLKIEPLSEQELKAVLTPDDTDKQVLRRVNRRARERDKRGEALRSALGGLISAEEDTHTEENGMETEEVTLPSPEEKETQMPKKAKKKRSEADILAQANPHIDDERIQITSPEVALSADKRPKTNLDVAIKEYRTSIKFIDAFKYVFHRVSYSIYLAALVAAVTTVFFITKTWKEAVITFAGGLGVIALSFLLMWYLSTRLMTDKRAFLLRIRQQEILFKSMDTPCYRELKTKFTVLKSLDWLLGKLSVILPLAVVLSATIAAVIVAFLFQYWLFNLILLGAVLAGIVTYWLVKLAADHVSYKLDVERNQQIEQQTLLDILEELRK